MQIEKRSGKFEDVIRSFVASEDWAGFEDSTQRTWGRQLADCIAFGLGDTPIEEMRPAVVIKFLKKFSDRPAKRQSMLRALHRLETWAMEDELLPGPICYGVKFKHEEEPHIPWEQEHVDFALANAPEDLKRAVALGAYTGQRQSDLVRMCWSDIKMIKGRRCIGLEQQKTKVKLWVVVHKQLDQLLDEWERMPGPILRRMGRDGRMVEPWCVTSLAKAWWTHSNKQPLVRLREAGLVFHGLRGFACVSLRRIGASEGEISKTVGMSVKMVSRYTARSNQLDDAIAAVQRLERIEG